MNVQSAPLIAMAGLLLHAGGVLAQGKAPESSPADGQAEAEAAAALQQRIGKAISAYEKVRRDKKKIRQRRRLLGWVGDIEAPRVSDYLHKELKAYARYAFGADVVAAIRKIERPEFADRFHAVLRSKKVHARTVAAITNWFVLRGQRGVDDMLELVEDAESGATAAVKSAVVKALARSGDKRAHAGIATFLAENDNPVRLRLLRLIDGVRDAELLDRARIRCVRKGNLIVSATAWRQLATQGHKRAKLLTLDVLERVVDKPKPDAAVQLITGLVLVRDRDFYPALLRFGAVAGKPVSAALRKMAPEAAKDPELMRFLIEDGIDTEEPGQRKAAKLLLSQAPVEVIRPLVQRVRKQLRRNRKQVMETAAGLHEILARDPSWAQDVAALAAKSDLESRLLGLSMLREMKSPAGLVSAQKYIASRDWELRSLVIRYMTEVRDVASIPLLIGRYGREEGRLQHELDRALFVHTGTRCWSRKDWQSWWKANKTGFVLPHADSVKSGGSSTGGNTVSYYDIPLVSSKIAFLVDRSGSMKAKVGTDRKRSRLALAKEQLRQVVGALPDTHAVNLIPYETGVQSVWTELRSLDEDNRKKLLKAINKVKFGQSTNTFGALMRAYEDPEVDTIYLLTDGQPTVGELIDPIDIIDEIRYINRTRQVVIHCISVGRESDLMRQLAAITGGEYKYVR